MFGCSAGPVKLKLRKVVDLDQPKLMTPIRGRCSASGLHQRSCGNSRRLLAVVLSCVVGAALTGKASAESKLGRFNDSGKGYDYTHRDEPLNDISDVQDSAPPPQCTADYTGAAHPAETQAKYSAATACCPKGYTAQLPSEGLLSSVSCCCRK